MDDLRRFARYFRPYKASLITGIFCILAGVIVNLTIPKIVGQAIDEMKLWTQVEWYRLTVLAGKVLAASFVSGTFLFLQRRLLIGASRNVEYDLRQDFYAHLVDQPLSFFHDHRVGDLMARATNDLAAVRQLAGPMIMYTLQTVFVVVIILPLMLRINWQLTALLFVTMPLVSLTVKFFGQQVHVRFEKIQEFFAQITVRAQENFSGVRVIRAYAQEGPEIEAFANLNRQYAERNLSLVRIDALMRPLMQFLIGIGFVLIIWRGVPLVVNGAMTVGDFTVFNMYLFRLIWPLIALGYVVNLYQRGMASLKRMNAILAIKPSIKDEAGVKAKPPIKGDLEFRNLTFAYRPGAEPVLKEINLTIAAGDTVAFVGRTGSGKSTLINLIPRLLESPPESVFLDDVPLRDYPLAQLRQSIGYVPQETFLFSDSLAGNIAFGVEKIERAEIEWAAEIAGLSEDIRSFPDGFETLVGERGITLSGGQKQRTAIARAVARSPRILILDDALSSVDTYTEEKILAQLRGVMRERTSLIVSHRISTVRDADLICVLDEGRIIERGTHEELLALGGEYADLYERQLLEEELAASNQVSTKSGTCLMTTATPGELIWRFHMQPQNQIELQRRVDSRLQVLRILWFGLVMSVVLYFVWTLMTGRPNNLQPNATLSLALLASGIVFVVASIAIKLRYVNLSIEQQSAVVLQQGYIIALALCEVPALFGLLDHYATGNPYYYAGFIVAVCGQLYHFPRRQHVLDASYRISETTPAPAYGEPVTSDNQPSPPLPPEF